MRAFAWTVAVLVVLGIIATAITWAVMDHNASERSKRDECYNEGGRRVYVKYGKGGDDITAGTYCVNILYKE